MERLGLWRLNCTLWRLLLVAYKHQNQCLIAGLSVWFLCQNRSIWWMNIIYIINVCPPWSCLWLLFCLATSVVQDNKVWAPHHQFSYPFGGSINAKIFQYDEVVFWLLREWQFFTWSMRNRENFPFLCLGKSSIVVISLSKGWSSWHRMPLIMIQEGKK